MTGANAHHGRRDNGLHAAAYASVGDVDPRVGEHLLDVLGNRGIAAYLQPTADQHPITRLTTLPARPTDRLFVDRAELDTAREFLSILTRDADPDDPAPAAAADGEAEIQDAGTVDAAASARRPAPSTRESTEFDEAWASIVAGFDHKIDGETAPWPAIEEVSRHIPDGGTPPETHRDYPRWRPSGRPAPVANDSLLDGLDTFGAGLADAEDDDENYHPPVPPPLPRLATVTIVSIIGVILGAAIVIHPALLPIDTDTAAILGCLSLLAGAIGLIGRLRTGDEDDEPDDPDHGAVI